MHQPRETPWRWRGKHALRAKHSFDGKTSCFVSEELHFAYTAKHVDVRCVEPADSLQDDLFDCNWWRRGVVTPSLTCSAVDAVLEKKGSSP